MISKTLKFFKMCLFAIAILFALELGLQLRSYLKEKMLPSLSSSNSAINVLVIGDSVLGNADEHLSVYYSLNEKLKETKDNNVVLIDASTKANSSAQANYAVDKLIDKYHPQISIVLLGGSDFEETNLKTTNPVANSLNYIKNVFYKTYLYKISLSLLSQMKMSYLENIQLLSDHKPENIRREAKSLESFQKYEVLSKAYMKGNISCTDLGKLGELTAILFEDQAMEIIRKSEACVTHMGIHENPYLAYFYIGKAYRNLNLLDQSAYYLTKSIEKNPHPESAYNILYWINYSKNNCPAMFDFFEKSLKITEPNRRMIWALRGCFAIGNRLKEGEDFFRKLSLNLNVNKNLSLLISQSLTPNHDSKLSSSLEDISPGDNYYYLAMLQYYRMNSMHQKANNLYLTKDLYLGLNQPDIDLKNFRELLSKLTKNGDRVLVLQYPTQPDWQVLEAIAPFGEHVTFISLSSVLEKNLKEHNILDLLSDDFIHMSAIGSRVIADELKKQIDLIVK